MENHKHPRLEHPALSLSEVGVCLHYVDRSNATDDTGHNVESEACSVLESMELDLLAYRFQDSPPFFSKVEVMPPGNQPRGAHLIRIQYPEVFEFHSEGRAPQLACPDRIRKAEIVVASTFFPGSGIRIWHLVIRPRPGNSFSEFDLIKLIHLYDGRTEGTDLKDKIRFMLGDEGDKGAPANGLPLLLGLSKGTEPELKAGTLELLVGDGNGASLEPAGTGYSDIFSVLQGARNKEDHSTINQLQAWLDQDCPQRRIIQAYCGIVGGIFDFDEIDEEEILDTLEPTFLGSNVFIRIHRRTLTCIADDDRSMRSCIQTFGISPYVVIPHALLIHNETLVDMAEEGIDSALGSGKSPLVELETAFVKAERSLNALHLPNVFNYVTERALFDIGSESRGSNARRSGALAKLQQLKGRIDIARDAEKSHGQFVVQLLLAIISLLQVKGVIADALAWEGRDTGAWVVLLAGSLVLGLIVWRSHVKELPQPYRNAEISGGKSPP